jgi:hypothetical protein
MQGALERLDRLLHASAPARYTGASLLFLVALAVRMAIDPIISGGYGLTAFYPAVILAAYWMGARPAILTAVLSTVAVLVFQAQRSGWAPIDARGWVTLVFFVGTSALAIYLLSAIRRRLSDLSIQHHRTEALVLSQAGLFRDHAERVTNHLQLIAAILEFRADGENEPEAARVLTNAASRTLLISRMHREFAGAPDRTIDFPAFARRLAQATDAERPVAIRGEALELPLEQATGLGLVLLDRLNASRGPVAVDIRREADDVALSLAVEDSSLPSSARELMLLDAVAIQLHGRMNFERDGDLSILRLSFPMGLQPPPAWAPLEHALH